jgi:hypothetical protein
VGSSPVETRGSSPTKDGPSFARKILLSVPIIDDTGRISAWFYLIYMFSPLVFYGFRHDGTPYRVLRVFGDASLCQLLKQRAVIVTGRAGAPPRWDSWQHPLSTRSTVLTWTDRRKCCTQSHGSAAHVTPPCPVEIFLLAISCDYLVMASATSDRLLNANGS